jgi:hypothetical protein
MDEPEQRTLSFYLSVILLWYQVDLFIETVIYHIRTYGLSFEQKSLEWMIWAALKAREKQ